MPLSRLEVDIRGGLGEVDVNVGVECITEVKERSVFD